MKTKPPSQLPVPASARRRPLKILPRVYLRFRLRLVNHAIARLERESAGEFGTDNLEPLVEEMRALAQERATLLSRLGED